MKSAFQWRGHSSILGQQFTKQPRKPDLEPKRMHMYAEATVSDETREAEIIQTNREVEYHFALAQKVTDDVMRGYHRDEARRLAAKVKALVQGRSAAFVAKLVGEWRAA
jgi:hypothetical protein